MTRRVTLCFQNLVEEYMVPVHALALIKGIAPVLTAGSDPIVFSVDDEEEAEVIRVVVKWLLRETIGDLVEARRQFCAAVRFADKWDVPALLKDLDVLFFSYCLPPTVLINRGSIVVVLFHYGDTREDVLCM